MSWRTAFLLGGITGALFYVACRFIACYMDQPPLPPYLAIAVGLISAVWQKRMEG